jgi:hypothetical protein
LKSPPSAIYQKIDKETGGRLARPLIDSRFSVIFKKDRGKAYLPSGLSRIEENDLRPTAKAFPALFPLIFRGRGDRKEEL